MGGWLWIFLAVALVVVSVALVIKFEKDNPCLKYGPSEFSHMVQVGKVMVPF